MRWVTTECKISIAQMGYSQVFPYYVQVGGFSLSLSPAEPFDFTNEFHVGTAHMPHRRASGKSQFRLRSTTSA